MRRPAIDSRPLERLAMTDTQNGTTGQRDRSPAFPNLTLKAALKRLEEFEAHFKRSPARPDRIGDAWGIKGKAYVDRTAAALKYFGLLEYQGSGTARQVVVSEEGRKFLRAQQEETKREVIRAAALRPKQIAHFWSLWGEDRPADAACIDELTLKNGFSDSGARDFLGVYDATISFAGLSDSDKISAVDQEANEATMTPAGHAMLPRQGETPSHIARRMLDESPTSVQYPQAKSPMLQEIFNLDEGPVTLSFPSELSQDSYEDLKDQLELFLRRAQRRAGLKEPTRCIAKETEEEEGEV